MADPASAGPPSGIAARDTAPWWRRHRSALIPALFVLLALLASGLHGAESIWTSARAELRAARLVAFLALVLVTAEWLTHLFTSALGRTDVARITRFAYRFAILLLLGTVLPFVTEQQSKPRKPTEIGQIAVLRGCVAAERGAAAAPPGLRCTSEAPQWVVAVGSGVRDRKPERGRSRGPRPGRRSEDTGGYELSGGLVVPLYFLILAVFGAGVSMARRVPEYQRRHTDEYREQYEEAKAAGATDLAPPMLPNEAREHLVFQIMQVLSAPAVAVVAYHLFAPERVGTTVAVGFAAGFSSEMILLRVRQAVDAMSGEKRSRLAAGTDAALAEAEPDADPDEQLARRVEAAHGAVRPPPARG